MWIPNSFCSMVCFKINFETFIYFNESAVEWLFNVIITLVRLVCKNKWNRVSHTLRLCCTNLCNLMESTSMSGRVNITCWAGVLQVARPALKLQLLRISFFWFHRPSTARRAFENTEMNFIWTENRWKCINCAEVGVRTCWMDYCKRISFFTVILQ